MSLFYPNLLKNSITSITVDDFKKLGVTGLLLDVDNTLTTHSSQFLDPEILSWIKNMTERGFKLTIVSNAFPSRVAPFAKKVGLEFVAFSCKPSPLGFWRGVKRLRLPRKQCVIIGDQIFTDILGSKLAGVKSILVLPIEIEEGKPTLKFKRFLEKYILKRYRKKRGLGDTD